MRGQLIAAPSGDVTFVFSDIERSTAHLRSLGDRYSQALDDHRELLRDAWQSYDGYEVGTEGDSFFVAFSDPVAAVSACLAAQRSLATHPWPDDDPFRVRMGAHCGHAIPRNGDYVALAVHQAARIAGAACGSQVLLSDRVGSACLDSDSVDVRSVGRWRVRDFDDPIELYVVKDDSTGLESRPPQLVPAAGHNIVKPRDRFIGRVREKSTLLDAVAPGRLVTVVGPGGVGKTRLVIETVTSDVDRWPDGIWFVSLGSVKSSHDVVQKLVSTIGIQTDANVRDRWSAMADSLRTAHALIVLDNCEHVASGVAPLVDELLANCPTVSVVATSQQPLTHATGVSLDEKLLRLEPLPVSEQTKGRPAAVDLFIERAGRIGWTPDKSEEQSIIDVCAHLDGLPLAIELAASWAEVLTPSELRTAFADPEQRSGMEALSTTGSRGTVAAAIESSCARLDPSLRTTLSAISVFPSSFSVEAAQRSMGERHIDLVGTRLALFELVTRSLVIKDRGDGVSRYRVLHTVRDHLTARAPVAEIEGAQRHAAAFYQSLIGPQQCFDRRWVATMGLEIGNVMALQNVEAVDEDDRFELAWSIGAYRDVTDAFVTGIDELTRFLAAEPVRRPPRVGLLTLVADLAIRIGELAVAKKYLAEAEQLAAEVGFPQWDDAGLHRTRAALALWNGDPQRCAQIASAGLDEGLSSRGRARLHDVRGIARIQLGEIAAAAQDFSAELVLWNELDFETKACTTHGNLAEALLRLGDLQGAARHQLECLDLAREFGQRVWIAHSAAMAAQLAARSGGWRRASVLQRAADSEYERLGLKLFASDEAARVKLRDAASARERADDFAESDLDEETLGRDSMIQQTTEQFRQLL